MWNVWITFIGITMAIAGIPQIMRIKKTKSSDDISLSFFYLVAHGQVWWFIHGIRIHDTALMITNFVCIVIAIYTIILIHIHRGE